MIPTTRDYLQAELDRYLPDYRTSRGEVRERARYELLHRIFPAIKADYARRRAAFNTAVAHAAWRKEQTCTK